MSDNELRGCTGLPDYAPDSRPDASGRLYTGYFEQHPDDVSFWQRSGGLVTDDPEFPDSYRWTPDSERRTAMRDHAVQILDEAFGRQDEDAFGLTFDEWLDALDPDFLDQDFHVLFALWSDGVTL